MNKVNKMQTIVVAIMMAIFFSSTGIMAQGMGPGGGKGDCPYVKDGKGMGPGHKGMRGHMRGGRGHSFFFGDVQQMKQLLALTDAQVNKIEKINLRFKKAHLAQKEKMMPKHIRLRRFLLEEKVNLKNVKALLGEIAAIEVEIRYMKIEHRIEIEKVLTPDQKRKLRSERRMKWKKMHDR